LLPGWVQVASRGGDKGERNGEDRLARGLVGGRLQIAGYNSIKTLQFRVKNKGQKHKYAGRKKSLKG